MYKITLILLLPNILFAHYLDRDAIVIINGKNPSNTTIETTREGNKTRIKVTPSESDQFDKQGLKRSSDIYRDKFRRSK